MYIRKYNNYTPTAFRLCNAEDIKVIEVEINPLNISFSYDNKEEALIKICKSIIEDSIDGICFNGRSFKREIYFKGIFYDDVGNILALKAFNSSGDFILVDSQYRHCKDIIRVLKKQGWPLSNIIKVNFIDLQNYKPELPKNVSFWTESNIQNIQKAFLNSMLHDE